MRCIESTRLGSRSDTGSISSRVSSDASISTLYEERAEMLTRSETRETDVDSAARALISV